MLGNQPRNAGIWPYIGALVISLIIIAAIPWLSIGFL
jgi:TRAP-type C4-dicarboxylate transport system permease large subunit